MDLSRSNEIVRISSILFIFSDGKKEEATRKLQAADALEKEEKGENQKKEGAPNDDDEEFKTVFFRSSGRFSSLE